LSTIFPLFRIFIDDYIHHIGTHVAGIIAANITGISQTYFTPSVPFSGVAPDVTIGACKFAFNVVIQYSILSIHCHIIDRVFGCAADIAGDGTYNSSCFATFIVI
jgi:hypothetical protein